MRERPYPQPIEERPRGRRGPKPKGLGLLVGVRIHPPQLAAIDAWIASLPDLKPTRPEAIRHLLEKALSDESGQYAVETMAKVLRVREEPSPARGELLLKKGLAEVVVKNGRTK